MENVEDGRKVLTLQRISTCTSAIQIKVGTKCDIKKCVHTAPLDAKIKQLTTEMFDH